MLTSYGDGAGLGVPAHGGRDFAFATEYHLRIQQVVTVEGQDAYDKQQWHDGYGDKERGVLINSGELDGLNHKDAVQAVAKLVGDKGLGELKTTWRLRDWGVSR